VFYTPTAVRSEVDISLPYPPLVRMPMVDDEDPECKIDIPNAALLFVYQSTDMKRLYRRYGNQLVVVDAVYRNARYALPLFFLVVRTNVNYQVAAVFVVQQETVQSIAAALRVIKDWSPDISPHFAMVDYSDEEIAALEETFPGKGIVDLRCAALWLNLHILWR
jgi:hypothetical protein